MFAPGTVVAAAQGFFTWLSAAISGIAAFIGANFALILGLVLILIGGLIFNFDGFVKYIGGMFYSLITMISNLFNSVLQSLTGLFMIFGGVLQTIFGAIIGFLTGDWTMFAAGIQTILNGVITYILGTVNVLASIVLGIIEFNARAITNMIDWLLNAFLNFISWIVSSFFPQFTSGWESFKTVVVGVWDTIYNSINNALGLIQEVINKITSIRSIGDIGNLTSGAANWIGNQVPWFEDGGYVPATGLAMLHAGEFVLPKQTVNSLSSSSSNGSASPTIITYNNEFNIDAPIHNDMDVSSLADAVSDKIYNNSLRRGGSL
jgi:phage-related protein